MYAKLPTNESNNLQCITFMLLNIVCQILICNYSLYVLELLFTNKLKKEEFFLEKKRENMNTSLTIYGSN